MRKILFRGKRIDNGKWMYGDLLHPSDGLGWSIEDFTQTKNNCHDVIPRTIGQYTGMTEFVVTDKNVGGKLFEGDIVEVWGWRRPKYDNPRSQYDGDFKVRAIIHFQNGAWMLDYDNEYNHNLEKLHGKEVYDRLVNGKHRLYDYGYHGNNEEWWRDHNSHYKWGDIVKIGNIYDNPELLEGTK